MGMNMENAILIQSKKGQGETNRRLDVLLQAQLRTNALLAQLVSALTDQEPVSPFLTAEELSVEQRPKPLFGGKKNK